MVDYLETKQTINRATCVAGCNTSSMRYGTEPYGYITLKSNNGMETNAHTAVMTFALG